MSILLSLGLPTPALAQILKILTLNFNAEPVPEDRGYLIRDRRLAAMVDWAQKNDPDIIAIQEGWNYRGSPSIVKYLAEVLGYDYTYRITMGEPLILYSSEGLLVKKKFHLTQREDFSLPHNAPWFGNGKTWVVIFGSVSFSIGARLTLEDGSPLYAFTGHLDASTQAGRDDQILAMDEAARRKVEENGEDWDRAHILLTGDFNSPPSANGVETLIGRGYHNTFADAHPGVSETDACSMCSDPTSPMFNPMSVAPGQVPAQNVITPSEFIDYTLTHGPGIQTLASTLTFTAPLNGVWMSDHYGVTSIISVGDTSPPAPVPNPLLDQTDLPAPSRVIHVTDEMMSCDTSECLHELPRLAGEAGTAAPVISAARGMTFINDSHTSFRVECDAVNEARAEAEGQTRIWPTNHAHLGHGEAASFFYDPGKDYRIVITKNSHLRVKGLVHAR